MPSTENPVVLITGASSGIGLALLRLLLRQNGRYRVAATARAKSLARFKDLGIHESADLRILPLDLTRPEEREAAVSELEKVWGGVDILINNAGISYRSVIEHASEEDVQLQFETNVFAPMHLIRLCLPSMRRKHDGRIINVSSVGGMMAMPTMGLYSSSKFALEGFSEALYYEMRPWNVRVSLIQPGFINSDSFEKVYISQRAHRSIQQMEDYSNYYYRMGKFIARLMYRSHATPESVAAKIFQTMQRDEPALRIPVGVGARFFTLFSRLAPRRFYNWLLYRNLPGIAHWGTGDHTDLVKSGKIEDALPKKSRSA